MKFIQEREVFELVIDGKESRVEADLFDVAAAVFAAWDGPTGEPGPMMDAAKRMNDVLTPMGFPTLSTGGCRAFLAALNKRCEEVKKKDLSTTSADSPGSTDSGPGS